MFIDAEDPSQFVTARQLLSLTKRIGRGLREHAGVLVRLEGVLLVVRDDLHCDVGEGEGAEDVV